MSTTFCQYWIPTYVGWDKSREEMKQHMSKEAAIDKRKNSRVSSEEEEEEEEEGE